jgi:hypothetical protein
MEPSGRNRSHRWQTRPRRKRLKRTKTVAVGCDQLPPKLHGKEAVDPLIIGPRPVLGGLQRTADGHGYPQRCATVARREGRQLRPPARSVGVDAGNAMETTG